MGNRGSGFGPWGQWVVCSMSAGVVLVSALAPADGATPIILVGERAGDQVTFSWYDVNDPLAAAPNFLLQLEHEEGRRILGLHNGMFYFVSSDRVLQGIDLATGSRYKRADPLPERYQIRGAALYLFSARDVTGLVSSIVDLNARAAMDVPIPEPEGGWRVLAPAGGDLYRLLHGELAQAGDRITIPLRIESFRSPGALPFDFELVLPAPGWRLGGGRPDALADDSPIALHPNSPLHSLSFQWLGGGRFALVGLEVVLQDFRVPDPAGESVWNVFVGDADKRSIRSFPLAGNLNVSPDGGTKGGGSGLLLDTRRMALVSDNADERSVSGVHFTVPRRGTSGTILHGFESLQLGRLDPVIFWKLDPGEERILLRTRREAACYDIYFGRHATVREPVYYDFADIVDLQHAPAAQNSPGAIPLWDEPGPDRAVVAGAHATGVTAEIHGWRSEAFQFTAITDQNAYPEGATVTVRLELGYTGELPVWTDPPVPAFPFVTGTLRGPRGSVQIAAIPGSTPRTMPEPVLLRGGGRLSHTLEWADLGVGEYVLAAAYGGGDGSDWRGLARAPLVTFRVGDAGEGETRLHVVLRKLMDSRSPHTVMPEYQEFQESRDEALPILMEMLRNARASEFGSEDYPWGMRSILQEIQRMNNPEVKPFFEEMLRSDEEPKRDAGYAAYKHFYQKAQNDEERAELRAVVRDAFESQPPRERARAMDDFEETFWPEIYEDAKVAAVGPPTLAQSVAVDVLTAYYAKTFDRFEGEIVAMVELLAEEAPARSRLRAGLVVEGFYRRNLDRPRVTRAIDDYRVRYPDLFGEDRFSDHNELWDVEWLGRAAGEPTESRLDLLQRSRAALEAHCGPAKEGFPATWEEFNEREAAREAYRESVRAWEECMRARPAPFRVPVISP
ncbi:MAG: hypothetical protein KF886_12185 [Candidatus Hydrogenedentes bacterium]|nr:hypothetical protein [Candidatus Hydrogenedentota bacterium]